MTITCSHCNGERWVCTFFNNGPDYRTHTSGYVECSTCSATGEVEPWHAARIQAGERMRQQRIAAGESLNAAAKRLGITPAQLSARERGRA